MASIINGCKFSWDDHANGFSNSLKDMLQRAELVDVTLVADGHLFGAHRLVLSALSPYFRQMFTQMPANQQAFVFLKDVPKKILDNLITFIYCGNVNVEQEHMENFLKTAKALDINGLADGDYANPSNVQSPIFNSSKPTFDGWPGMQYQSTRTTRVLDQVNTNGDGPSRFEPPANGWYQSQDNSDGEATNEMNETGDNYSNNYDDEYYGSENGIGEPIDSDHGAQANQWNFNYAYDVEVKQQAKPNVIKPAKRVKRNNDTSEYNIIADIRPNDKGGENLYRNENKFLKSYKPNRFGQQRWECTKKRSRKCLAAVTTMDVNGITMLKILADEHSHPE